MSESDRPEPVTEAAKAAALVSSSVVAVGAVLVLLGWATSEQVQAWAVVAGGIVTALGALLAYVMPLVTARGARAQVTPLASPVGVDGTPLIASAQPVPAPAPAPVEITDALRALGTAPTPTYDAVAADLAAHATRPMAAVLAAPTA